MFDFYRYLVTRHARKVLWALTAVTAFLGVCSLRLKTNNAIETWLLDDDPRRSAYHEFVKAFGTEEFVLVVFSDRNLFSQETFRQIHRLSEQLKALKTVSRVWSLSEVYRQGVSRLPAGSYLTLDKFGAYIVGHPLFTGNLISDDGSTTALVVVLTPEGVRDRRGTVSAIRKLTKTACPERKFHFAGPPVMSAELDRIATRDPRVFTPVVVIFASALLFALFRSRAGVRIPMAVAGMSIVWTLGVFSLMGGTMNLVLSVMPPLILVAAIEDSVFLLCDYQRRIGGNHSPENSILETVRRLWKPCFMTSLTTAIGFGSLALSRFSPVRSFGFLSAMGIAFAFLITMLFVPASIVYKRGAGISASSELDRHTRTILTFISRFNSAHPVLVLLLFGAISIAGMAGITQLRVEANTLKFFPPDSEIRESYAFIEKRLTGLSPFEILLQGEDVRSASVLAAVDRIEDNLSHQPFVTHSFSIRDLQVGFQQGHPLLPASEGLKIPAALSELARLFVTPDGKTTHISGRGLTMNSIYYERAMCEIEAFTKSILPEGVTAELTGVVPMITSMDSYLLMTLIKSFATAFVVIGALMAATSGSVWLGVLSMIPNLVPMVVTLGVMGFLKIDLSPATATVASISLGIAVDNTIHYLHRYADFMKSTGDRSSARSLSTMSIGKPMIYTILTLLAGFIVMGLSDFRPTRYFGLLSGLCLLLALLCDLFLLPALLSVFRPALRRVDAQILQTQEIGAGEESI